MRIIGLDPGLRHTGWGVIDVDGNHLRHVANGAVDSDPECEMAVRLVQLFDGVSRIIAEFAPAEAAVEKTFVSVNPVSTLKLGHARGVVMLAPARAGMEVAEYSPNFVKKAVVGTGHAAKKQVAMMVCSILPGIILAGPDAADALAVAICHAHYAATKRLWSAARDVEKSAVRKPAEGIS